MRRPLLPAFVLCLLTLLVFLPLLNAQFLLWDDNKNIYANPWYEPISLENTARFWMEAYNQTYRPLVHTVWAGIGLASYSATPLHIPGWNKDTNLDARVFHATNLLLHVFNVLLVWRLARLWVKNEWYAAAGALLFALHPLQVESVGWITGFNEVLCATFCLGSTWCYCRWAQQDLPVHSRLYISALVLYVLALLTKPAAVALPLVLWVLDYFIIRKQARAASLRLASWLVLGAVWSIITALVHPDEYAGVAPPLYVRPFLAGDALAWYAQKVILPYPLAADPGRLPEVVMNSPLFWVRWLIPVGIVAVAWRFRGRSPWFLAAVLCTLAWLLPVAGLKPFHFQLVYSLVADRYMYFALAIVAVAVAYGLENVQQTLLRIGYGLLLAGWAALSSIQARTWQDNFTFFQHTLAVNPRSWMASANLGTAWDNERRPDLAQTFFEKALEIKPSMWEMHVNLSRYALAIGDEAKALKHSTAVLKSDPKNRNLNLARYALAIRDEAKAREYYTAVLKSDPKNAEAQRFLAQQ